MRTRIRANESNTIFLAGKRSEPVTVPGTNLPDTSLTGTTDTGLLRSDRAKAGPVTPPRRTVTSSRSAAEGRDGSNPSSRGGAPEKCPICLDGGSFNAMMSFPVINAALPHHPAAEPPSSRHWPAGQPTTQSCFTAEVSTHTTPSLPSWSAITMSPGASLSSMIVAPAATAAAIRCSATSGAT